MHTTMQAIFVQVFFSAKREGKNKVQDAWKEFPVMITGFPTRTCNYCCTPTQLRVL